MSDDRHWLRKAWDFIWKEKCPECNKFGGRLINRNLIRSSDHIGTTMRREPHYDKQNRYIGSTLRSVSVTMRTNTYDVYYRCDYCGFVFSKIEKQTSPFT